MLVILGQPLAREREHRLDDLCRPERSRGIHSGNMEKCGLEFVNKVMAVIVYLIPFFTALVRKLGSELEFIRFPDASFGDTGGMMLQQRKIQS